MIINQTNISDLAKINKYLQQASVELEYFVVSFGTLVFKVSKQDNEIAFLCFSGVDFVDCPNKMENVHFSINDKRKQEIIKQYIPKSAVKLSSELLLFDIDSQEGKFSVLAIVLWFEKDNKTEEVRVAIENAYSHPIWNGGITFGDLAKR